MLVVEEEVPPRAVNRPAVNRAGERAEALRRLELPVDVELVGEKFRGAQTACCSQPLVISPVSVGILSPNFSSRYSNGSSRRPTVRNCGHSHFLFHSAAKSAKPVFGHSSSQ